MSKPKEPKLKKPKAKKTRDHSKGIIGHRGNILYIGLGMTFFVFLLAIGGFFQNMELRSLNWRFALRGPRPINTPIVIVGIDDDSLNGWVDDKDERRSMPENWTWPRDYYGTAVERLKKAGAKLIAFDMVFSESSTRNKAGDLAFAAACKRAGNVILPERYVTKQLGEGNTGLKRESLIRPLAMATLDTGHANDFPDPDNFLRSFQLVLKTGGKLDPAIPSLDLAVLRQYLWGKAVVPDVSHPEKVIMDGGDGKPLAIPTDEDADADINFVGPPASFTTISFHDVYYGTADMSVFKGKIVYIGSTSSILHDNHPTPFAEKDVLMPGVEVRANLLDTILTHNYLKKYAPYVELLLLLFLGVLTSFLTFRVKPLIGALAVLVELTAFLLVVGFMFNNNIVVPMASPVVAILLSYVGIAVYKGVVEENRAKATRAMFSRYVSHKIVDEILKNPEAVKLGGEVKEVSILFSDVRGFTAMSEKLSAPEVVEVLNEYLTAMVDIVIANNGTIDKYVGDAVMAVWGSPLHDPTHWQSSVRTAVQMMEVLHELQKKWKIEGKPEIDIGIGINSGHVVAGNMGHPLYKMDYTVIGDDVNLAARLESANKELRAHVLISGSTYEATSDMVDVIKHPDIHVKGKEKAVEVYEVTGWKGQGRAAWAVPLKH